MDISFKSRSFVLICIFIINQYVICLENNSPLSETSRFVAGKPLSSSDQLHNAGLLSYLKNLYQIERENDIGNSLQQLFNNNDFYRKRTANKVSSASSGQWNRLHGLVGKRNEQQLNDDQDYLTGTSNDFSNDRGYHLRSLRANKWNQLGDVWVIEDCLNIHQVSNLNKATGLIDVGENSEKKAEEDDKFRLENYQKIDHNLKNKIYLKISKEDCEELISTFFQTVENLKNLYRKFYDINPLVFSRSQELNLSGNANNLYPSTDLPSNSYFDKFYF